MDIQFFDVHSHLNSPQFAENFNLLEKTLKDKKVLVVSSGFNIESSRSSVDLAKKYSEIYASVGIHPSEASDEIKKYWPVIDELAEDKKVVAIGETGLDYHFKENISEKEINKLKALQRELFLYQIKLSHKLNKPLVIHCREAFSDLIKILKENKEFLLNPAGIVHFFSGTVSEAESLLDLNFYFSFNSTILRKPRPNFPNYGEVIDYLPLNSILIETDAPYIKLNPYNKPEKMSEIFTEIADKIAEIKIVDTNDAREATVFNALEVFGIFDI
jgi:TatD DNase family protein